MSAPPQDRAGSAPRPQRRVWEGGGNHRTQAASVWRAGACHGSTRHGRGGGRAAPGQDTPSRETRIRQRGGGGAKPGGVRTGPSCAACGEGRGGQRTSRWHAAWCRTEMAIWCQKKRGMGGGDGRPRGAIEAVPMRRGGESGAAHNQGAPRLFHRGDGCMARQETRGIGGGGRRGAPQRCQWGGPARNLAAGPRQGPYVWENPADSRVRGHSHRANLACVAMRGEEKRGLARRHRRR